MSEHIILSRVQFFFKLLSIRYRYHVLNAALKRVLNTIKVFQKTHI